MSPSAASFTTLSARVFCTVVADTGGNIRIITGNIVFNGVFRRDPELGDVLVVTQI